MSAFVGVYLMQDYIGSDFV